MFDAEFVAGLRERLNQHPIYESLRTPEDLRIFMSHHIYSVWDFMSLIKYLQNAVAPARWPWQPGADPTVQRFINELVLEEETDEAGPDRPGEFSSHFDLYLRAMREIGANPEAPLRFVGLAAREGIDAALAAGIAPPAAAEFTRATFSFIRAGQPHVAAAALALGREHVIPEMFRAFLSRMGIAEQQAPVFHYYLRRHIHLDEDFHAPLSLRLLHGLCAGDPARIDEARDAARQAVDARLAFWDGVCAALPGATRGG
ncbi:MAG TPA: DUF3050 domain-containing protein [Gallionellaceae bacterium]|nr:DUF3050 domain-containing protein [Gallionellaceae bacterium]